MLGTRLVAAPATRGAPCGRPMLVPVRESGETPDATGANQDADQTYGSTVMRLPSVPVAPRNAFFPMALRGLLVDPANQNVITVWKSNFRRPTPSTREPAHWSIPRR